VPCHLLLVTLDAAQLLDAGGSTLKSTPACLQPQRPPLVSSLLKQGYSISGSQKTPFCTQETVPLCLALNLLQLTPATDKFKPFLFESTRGGDFRAVAGSKAFCSRKCPSEGISSHRLRILPTPGRALVSPKAQFSCF